MKILITGVSGLVGGAICNYFLQKGVIVTGIPNMNKSGIEHENYSEIHIDLANKKLDIKNDFNAIIHCAAVIPNNKCNEDELLFINKEIDLNVISFCNKAKLIYFSTAFLYAPSNNKLKENSSLYQDIKGYYLSKKASEDILSISKMNYVIFRLSSPYSNLRKQHNVMSLFAEKIRNGTPITLIGKGERRQNFIHTDDISEACYKALIKNSTGVYNLTYKYNYSMYQLASFIKEICSSDSELIFDADKNDIQPNVNFDNSKLKLELNWEPVLDLKSGLIKTLLN